MWSYMKEVLCPICHRPMELRFIGLEVCWWWCNKCKAEALIRKEELDAEGNISEKKIQER